MGQYGNQPDFGTIVTTLAEIGLGTPFPPSAIYIGEIDGEGLASLKVQIVGNEPGIDTAITGIQAGTILPFIVTEIGDVVGVRDEDILLYR
jgi:hypothetical protein